MTVAAPQPAVPEVDKPPEYEGWALHTYDPTPSYDDSLEILDHAVIALIEKEPAYADLVMQLQVVFDWSPPLPDGTPTKTLGVDPEGRLFVNPFFFNQLERSSKMGVLMHECDHVLLEHPDQLNTYENKLRANIAMDLAINCWNKRLPFFNYTREDVERMAKGMDPRPEIVAELSNPRKAYGHHPTHYGYVENLIAREYYEMLPRKDEDLQKMVGLRGHGGLPQHHWHAGPAAKQKMRQRVDDFVKREQAKGRGTMPGSFVSRLEQIEARSKTPWNLLLRQMARMHLAGERGYQFRRPDRRTGIIPGRSRLKKCHLMVAIDTSGSTMGQRGAFAAEISAIYKQTNAEISLLECDAAVVKDHYPFKSNMPQDLKGGGGTAFRPVFDYVHQKGLKISLLIYLTDGYGEWKLPKPDHVTYPVIWVTTGRDPTNWGTIIQMDQEAK